MLDAALLEFSERGRAGARTRDIAARAGVNKQLISHHFGGKDGLYRALIERWLAHEQSYGGSETPLADLAAAYVEDGLHHRDLHRLLLRASLEDDEDDEAGGGVGPDDLADMQSRQEAGEVTDELDAAFVLLTLQAVAAAGVVFPGDVRRLTGQDPASPDFAAWHSDQLRTLVRLLRPKRRRPRHASNP